MNHLNFEPLTRTFYSLCVFHPLNICFFHRILQHSSLGDVLWFTPCVITLPGKVAGSDAGSDTAENGNPVSAPPSHHQCVLLLLQSTVIFIPVDRDTIGYDRWRYSLADVEFRDCPVAASSPSAGMEDVVVCLLPQSTASAVAADAVRPLLDGVNADSPSPVNLTDCLLRCSLPSPLAAKVLFAFLVVLSKQHHFYIA